MKNRNPSLKSSLIVCFMFASLSACETIPAVRDHQQASFATPEEAVTSLMVADRNDDKEALMNILGPQAEKLVYSGDEVADKDAQQRFLAAYDTYHRLDADNPSKETLIVGSEEWPMPIPLVRVGDAWAFDTEAGQQAILDRRIGRNELNVIEVCRAYVIAQHEYANLRKLSNGYPEYAQKINSSAGMHDGLYWPVKAKQTQSPFGPLMADAQAEGYDEISGHHTPYQGYFFRVLHRQSADAAGGEKDYMVDGHMVRGFGLIAYPATYGDSGIKTFIVNQTGIVYQADLGTDTANKAAQIRSFDPNDSWQSVQ